jgi:hypothetical protein
MFLLTGIGVSWWAPPTPTNPPTSPKVSAHYTSASDTPYSADNRQLRPTRAAVWSHCVKVGSDTGAASACPGCPKVRGWRVVPHARHTRGSVRVNRVTPDGSWRRSRLGPGTSSSGSQALNQTHVPPAGLRSGTPRTGLGFVVGHQGCGYSVASAPEA